MEYFTHEPEEQSFDIGTSTLGTIALREGQLVASATGSFFSILPLNTYPNILDLLIQGHFRSNKKSAQVAAVYEQAVKNLVDRDCLIVRCSEYQHLARRCRGESRSDGA